MKTPQLIRYGTLTATLLAMLTLAHAQDTGTSSPTALPNPQLAPPPPPPPPPLPDASLMPPPPVYTGTTSGPVNSRGVTTASVRTVTSRRGPLGATVWTTEKAMNDAFIIQFNNTGSFGGGRMPAPTMRIDPGMRLDLTDQTKVDGPAKTITASYRVYSLELIGIAMHDKPVAFVVVRHKDNTASLNNRVLTDFEESALKELQSGKDVVDQLTKTDRLVVGAVRAEQSCVACHDGAKVGDLLGAFSYHLSLVEKPTSPTIQLTVGGAPDTKLSANGGSPDALGK